MYQIIGERDVKRLEALSWMPELKFIKKYFKDNEISRIKNTYLRYTSTQKWEHKTRQV